MVLPPSSTQRPAPSAPPARPLGALIGLLLTVCCDALVQVLWKRAAVALPDSSDPLQLIRIAVFSPALWLLLGLLIGQLFLWLAVLRRLELSFAQPFTALSYLGVALLSWWCLGEVLSLRAGLSLGLILAGVALIASEP